MPVELHHQSQPWEETQEISIRRWASAGIGPMPDRRSEATSETLKQKISNAIYHQAQQHQGEGVTVWTHLENTQDPFMAHIAERDQ